jgi:hypothetical protein
MFLIVYFKIYVLQNGDSLMLCNDREELWYQRARTRRYIYPTLKEFRIYLKLNWGMLTLKF